MRMPDSGLAPLVGEQTQRTDADNDANANRLGTALSPLTASTRDQGTDARFSRSDAN